MSVFPFSDTFTIRVNKDTSTGRVISVVAENKGDQPVKVEIVEADGTVLVSHTFAANSTTERTINGLFSDKFGSEARIIRIA